MVMVKFSATSGLILKRRVFYKSFLKEGGKKWIQQQEIILGRVSRWGVS
jgi:hypothetical protein